MGGVITPIDIGFVIIFILLYILLLEWKWIFDHTTKLLNAHDLCQNANS